MPDGTITTFNSNGCGEARFDSAGNLYVAAFKKIIRFTPGLKEQTVYYEGKTDGVDNIYSLAIDSMGNAFFGDWHPGPKADTKKGVSIC